LGIPIVWWRKPYGGLDGHGTSPKGRCEDSPDPSEVSSLGKLRVFLISYNLITLKNIKADLEMLTGP
jgi:hypothetical protein